MMAFAIIDRHSQKSAKRSHHAASKPFFPSIRAHYPNDFAKRKTMKSDHTYARRKSSGPEEEADAKDQTKITTQNAKTCRDASISFVQPPDPGSHPANPTELPDQ